jgi:predicted PurR-regulated permease PerM
MFDGGATQGSSRRTLYGLAAAALIMAGLRYAAPVLVPTALALFLCILVLPLFGALLRRRIGVGLSVLVTMTVLLAGLTVFVLLLLGSLSELREIGPHYVTALRERIADTAAWWHAKGIAIRDWVPERWREGEALAQFAGGLVARAFQLVTETVLVLLILVFLLAEAAGLPRKRDLLPPRVRRAILHFGDASRDLQRYLVIKTLLSAAVGLTVTLWLGFLGVDFPVLCGLLAFAFHFVPNVGAALAAAPAMLIALAQYDFVKALVAGAGYLVIGLVLGNLVEPALMGRRLNLSSLAVFLSLVVWGWLWGPIGMFLSVPMTMAIKMALEHSRDWAWVAHLLGSPPAAEPAPAGAAPPPAAEPAPSAPEHG